MLGYANNIGIYLSYIHKYIIEIPITLVTIWIRFKSFTNDA